MDRSDLPDIFEFKSYTQYFEKIINNSKENDTNKGFRYFSHILNWSPSYMHDVVKGKKKLSVMKGLEFSTKFSLDQLEQEYLLLLILKDGPSEKLKKKAHRALSTWQEKQNLPNKKITSEIDQSFLAGPLLRFLIINNNKFKDFNQAAESFQKEFPATHITRSEVINTLEVLKKNDYVTIKSGYVNILKAQIENFDFVNDQLEDGSVKLEGNWLDEIQKKYFLTTIDYLNKPFGELFFRNGYSLLRKKEQFLIRQKIDELREIIDNLDQKNHERALQQSKDEAIEDYCVIQYGLSLFEVSR